MLSHIQLFVAPWTVACQSPQPMEFSRQEYLSGVPFPTPGELPKSGIKPESLPFPELAGGFFTTSANGTPLQYSCPENRMDGGAWWAAVHGVAKSWT